MFSICTGQRVICLANRQPETRMYGQSRDQSLDATSGYTGQGLLVNVAPVAQRRLLAGI